VFADYFLRLIRKVVETTLNGDANKIPSHVLKNVDERISRAVRKNAALDADHFHALKGKLEYFDLRELQDTITSPSVWSEFEKRFNNKNVLIQKFDQLAELRNSIRHSRGVSEIVRKEGEASIAWFKAVLAK
jgi:hypothetical protein